MKLFDANAVLLLGRATEEEGLKAIPEVQPDAEGLHFSTYMFRDTLA